MALTGATLVVQSGSDGDKVIRDLQPKIDAAIALIIGNDDEVTDVKIDFEQTGLKTFCRAVATITFETPTP